MKTGQINVQTENIFPIIKKFLYSDHEIFLRELVSNAVDASQKLKFFAGNGEFKGELGDLKVEVLLNKEAKTLTIRDNGIGMTSEEIDKYINQIAFSGAEEFVQKYSGKEGAEQIIGHFVDHRHEVLVRKTKFELIQSEKRAHILEWLLIALDILDIISLGVHSSANATNSLLEQILVIQGSILPFTFSKYKGVSPASSIRAATS